MRISRLAVLLGALAVAGIAASCGPNLGKVSAQAPVRDFSYANTVAINVGPAGAPKLDLLNDAIKKSLLEEHVFDAVVDPDQADVILNVDVRSADHGSDLMVQLGAGGEGKVDVSVALIDAKSSAEITRFLVAADSKQRSETRINGVNVHVVDDRVGQAMQKAGATIGDNLRQARSQQPSRKHAPPPPPAETPDPLELERKAEATNSTPAPIAHDVQSATDAAGAPLASPPWPADVGISRRDQCVFRCIEGADPVDSTRERHLEAWVQKQLGAARYCAISTSDFHPTNFYASFTPGGYLRFSIDVTASRDSMQACIAKIPGPPSAMGPANARWKCTDYCE